ARRSFGHDRRSIRPFSLSPSSRRVSLIGCRSSMSASSLCLRPSNRSSRARTAHLARVRPKLDAFWSAWVRSRRATSLILNAISLLALIITSLSKKDMVTHVIISKLIIWILFCLGPGDPDHLTPDLALLGGKRERGFGRAGEGPRTRLEEACLCGRLGRDVFDGGVELVDHRARRAGRHHECCPRGHDEIGLACLCHGGHVRQCGPALGRRHGKRAHLPALDDGDVGGEVVDREG